MVRRGPCRRDVWHAEVLRTKAIPDACRVLLLVLAERMSDGAYVSISQKALADLLDVDTRRISGRVTQAKRAGLLRQTGGYRGRTSEYQGVLPERKVAELCRPNSVVHSAPETDTNRTGKVAEFRRPNTRVTNATTTQQRKTA